MALAVSRLEVKHGRRPTHNFTHYFITVQTQQCVRFRFSEYMSELIIFAASPNSQPNNPQSTEIVT